MGSNPSTNEVEYTKQSYPQQQMDPEYIKLRLDTQQLHQMLLDMLEGYRTVVVPDEKTGSYVEVRDKFGDELMNKRGRQNLLSQSFAMVNSHTILGNTKREELYKFMGAYERSLITQLTLNRQEWGVDLKERDHIVDTFVNMTFLVLSRTIDNGERNSLSQALERIQAIFQKDKQRVI